MVRGGIQWQWITRSRKLHDVRAVGVGPAICGWRDGRERVREMLVVRRESGVTGRLLDAELQSEWDVASRRWWRRDGIGGSLIIDHRVGRRVSTFKHVGRDRHQT